MDWEEDKTASRKTYVMAGDRRYMVEQWGLGSWTAWFDGLMIHRNDMSLGSRAEAQAFAELHRDAPEQRIERAMDLIMRYGGTDGAHHKQWVLNKVALTLSGGAVRLADEGIAP
jgi:hypothetical protein